MRGSIMLLVLLASGALQAIAQPPASQDPPIRYVDSHIHPFLKNYYRERYAQIRAGNVYLPARWESTSNWIDRYAPRRGALDSFRFNGVWGKASLNEATYDVLASSAAPSGIFCSAIYTMEKQAIANGPVPLPKLPLMQLAFNRNKHEEQSLHQQVSRRKARGSHRNTYRNLWGYFSAQPGLLLQLMPAYLLTAPKLEVSIALVNAIAVSRLGEGEEKRLRPATTVNNEERKAELQFATDQAEEVAGLPGKVIMARDETHLAQLYGRMTSGEHLSIMLHTVEGTHNFFGANFSHIDSLFTLATSPAARKQVLDNIDLAKEDNHRLFFVTPGHLFWNHCIGNARGLDVEFAREALGDAMWDEDFATVDEKWGDGIIRFTQDQQLKSGRLAHYCDCDRGPKITADSFGWRVVQHLLQPSIRFGKPTYIDFRHSDPRARVELIQFVRDWNGRNPSKHIPIIVSHAAVSGKSQSQSMLLGLAPFADRYLEFHAPRKFYQYPLDKYTTALAKGDSANAQYYRCFCDSMHMYSRNDLNAHMDTAGWFLPISNNLFTEEIAAVYETEGIIGITLEERVLGAGTGNYHDHRDTLRRAAKHYADSLHTTYSKATLDSMQIAEPFMRNLFFIVAHSSCKGAIKSWEHVAIGSDFDGIINPIDLCPSVASIPGFFKFLRRHFAFYDWHINGYGNSLACGQSGDILLRKVFYENGERFALKYF